MGEQYNVFAAPNDDSPFSEKPNGRLKLAIEAAPDQAKAVRIIQMQKATGLPEDVVSTHLDDIEKQSAAVGFDADKFLNESPIVAGWMAESPQHAALLKEEIGRAHV